MMLSAEKNTNRTCTARLVLKCVPGMGLLATETACNDFRQYLHIGQCVYPGSFIHPVCPLFCRSCAATACHMFA